MQTGVPGVSTDRPSYGYLKFHVIIPEPNGPANIRKRCQRRSMAYKMW